MILNRQRQVHVSVRELEEFLVRALRLVRVRPDAIGVSLVSNAQIAKWNWAYRRKKSATDVLSFPADVAQCGKRDAISRPKSKAASSHGLDAAFSSDGSYLGDIAIAPAVARKNARRFGVTSGVLARASFTSRSRLQQK